MKNTLFLLALAVLTAFSSCSNASRNTTSEPIVSQGIAVSGPYAIIYKTKANYNMLVPVIMNSEKTDIVAYPAPGDLKYKGKPAIPTILEDGFLLDNRGINENVAFLDISYEAYMALNSTPSKEELMSMILDKDPLSIMYNCGKRATYNNEVQDLNAFILENNFSAFEKLK